MVSSKKETVPFSLRAGSFAGGLCLVFLQFDDLEGFSEVGYFLFHPEGPS